MICDWKCAGNVENIVEKLWWSLDRTKRYLARIHKSIKGGGRELLVLYSTLEKNNLELTRQRIRGQALQRFKHIRTCVLARELCLLIRTNRVALNPKDVADCCNFISTLCKEAGCTEPSELCQKATKAVLANEEEYLDFCMQSCQKCGESRRPAARQRPIRERTTYVA